MMRNEVWRLAINGAKRSFLLMLTMAPMMLLIFLTEIYPVDNSTWFNLFLISIFGVMGTIVLIGKIFDNPFQPERIQLDTRFRDLGLEITAWAKEHEQAAFLMGMLGLLLVFLPLNSFWLWLCSLGFMTTTSSTVLVFVFLIAILFIPLSVLESIYESMVRPKRATVTELERIVNMLHSKMELTRKVIERASRTRIVQPNRKFIKISILLMLIALFSMEMAIYSVGGDFTQNFLIFLAVGASLLAIMIILASEHFGKAKTMLQELIETKRNDSN